MVRLTVTNNCTNGKHEACRGSYAPPMRNGEIVLGGWICQCSCHQNKKSKKKKSLLI